MKKENITRILSVTVLFILWILPCFELEIFEKTYVYFIAFALSVAVMYITKRVWISFAATAVITIAVSFYNYEYLFLVLPVVLLVFAHYYASVVENKKGDSFNSANNCATLSFVCIIGEVFYSFIQYNNIEVHRIENVFTALKLVPLFIALFVFLTVQSRKKENYRIVPKKKADKYTMIYIISLLGLIVSLFTFHSLNGYGIQSIRTEYIFWFGYVITMGINRDPYIEIAVGRIKADTEALKVSYK